MQNNNILNFDGFSVQIVNVSTTTIKNIINIFAEAFIIFSGRVFLVMPDVTICYNGKKFWFDDNTSESLKGFYFSKIKPKDIYGFISEILYKERLVQEEIALRMENISRLLDEQFDISSGGENGLFDLDLDLSEFEDNDSERREMNDLLDLGHDATFASGYSGVSILKTDGNKPTAIQRAREHLASFDKDEPIGFLKRAMKILENNAL